MTARTPQGCLLTRVIVCGGLISSALFANDAPWILNPPGLEVISPDRPGEDAGYNLRQTRDGSYIVAGCVTTPGRDRDLAVFKFRPDLSLDSHFGHDGIWTWGGSGTDLAIDLIEVEGEDGEPRGFLVVGIVEAGDGEFGGPVHHGKIDVVLARLTDEGEPDPAFGTGGFRFYGGGDDDEVVVHLHNYSEPGERLVQTPDGFVVAAMTRSNDGDLDQRATIGRAGGRDAMIFAVDMHGDYRASFGDRGILRIGSNPGPEMGRRSPNEFVWSLVSDPRGGFVGAGYHLGADFRLGDALVRSPGNSSADGDNTGEDVKQHKMDGWVFRFDDSGRPMTDWADHGISFIGGSWQEKIYDVLPVGDGYLVTGRTASWDLEFARPQPTESTFDRVLLKLDTDGRLDRSFGQNGLVLEGGDGDDQALRIAELRAGGDLIWLSQSTSRPLPLQSIMPVDFYRQAVLTRLSPSGVTLQNWSLGERGEDKPVGFIVDREGRIVVVGFRNPNVRDEKDPQDPAGRNLLLMRFMP
ncbi:MAG: hypothetical protein R3F07_01950 [Opitutaceae bacterium]